MKKIDIFPLLTLPRLEERKLAIKQNLVNVDQRDDFGKTPLMKAREYEIIEVLLDAGADVNAQKDYQGVKPLMCAVQAPDKGFEVVTLLLERGADPSLNSPMVLAERKYITLLLSYGSDPNSRRHSDGTTMLITSIHRHSYDDIKTLLENKADPNIRNNKGETALSKAQAHLKNDDSRFSEY